MVRSPPFTTFWRRLGRRPLRAVTTPTAPGLNVRYPACSRRAADARFPPNCDVRGRDLLCPLHVDSSRLLRANSGRSRPRGEQVNPPEFGRSQNEGP